MKEIMGHIWNPGYTNCLSFLVFQLFPLWWRVSSNHPRHHTSAISHEMLLFFYTILLHEGTNVCTLR